MIEDESSQKSTNHFAEITRLASDSNLLCKKRFLQDNQGFSLVELLIVMSIIMTLTAASIFSFTGHRNAYRTEDQSLRIIDLMNNSRMRAIAKRQIIRFEINVTKKQLRIIDENLPEAPVTVGGLDPHNDDALIRQEAFDDPGLIAIGQKPSNVMTEIAPVIAGNVMHLSTFTPHISNHPLSKNDNVWVVRFRSNGSAVDDYETPSYVNSCVYVSLSDPDGLNRTKDASTVRAITIFGGNGQTKYWGYDGTNFVER